MNRQLNFSLNKFDSVPISLRTKPKEDKARNTCEVDLARLYHHYYLDSYGRNPPSPDFTNFEYVQFLADTADFRMRGSGIGDSTTKKRHASNELGQAFCRWFLYEHLGVTYFAHMDRILDKGPIADLDGVQINRSGSGDAPDYLCADSRRTVYLAEAKGRYSSISFHNQEFEKWRGQFSRVEIRDKNNTLKVVKGFIVGTRFSTENNSHSLKSGIYAEDPASPGEEPIDQSTSRTIHRVIQKQHYANLFEKLNQPLVSASMRMGSIIPEQLQIQAVSWRLMFDEFKHIEFVGGYYQTLSGNLPFTMRNGSVERNPPDSFRLDQGRGIFLGLERSIFESVCSSARRGADQDNIVAEPMGEVPPFYSAISLLRDGSIVAPAEFFEPADLITV